VDSQIYRGKKHFLESVGLRTEKDLRVLWTARKTNEWVFNKAGVRAGTVRHRQSKEANILYGHNMRKQESCREKEIMQGTMPGARRRERPRTACMDNIKTWTGLPVEESI